MTGLHAFPNAHKIRERPQGSRKKSFRRLNPRALPLRRGVPSLMLSWGILPTWTPLRSTSRGARRRDRDQKETLKLGATLIAFDRTRWREPSESASATGDRGSGNDRWQRQDQHQSAASGFRNAPQLPPTAVSQPVVSPVSNPSSKNGGVCGAPPVVRTRTSSMYQPL